MLTSSGYCSKPRFCWSWHRGCFQIAAGFGEESEHIACSRGPVLVPASLSVYVVQTQYQQLAWMVDERTLQVVSRSEEDMQVTDLESLM